MYATQKNTWRTRHAHKVAKQSLTLALTKKKLFQASVFVCYTIQVLNVEASNPSLLCVGRVSTMNLTRYPKR